MKKIKKPGIYDITEDEYDADPCVEPSLRSSLAWKLVAKGSTPRHAWYSCQRLNPNYVTENKRNFDIGKAAHKMLLGKGAEFRIIKFPHYKTKAAQDERDQAYIDGAIPLLEHEYKQVCEMATAARRQLAELVDAGTIEATPFEQEQTERTIIWQERNGIWCRARLDGLPEGGETIDEYKSTNASADPALWQFRQMRQLGYHHRLAFYRRGLEALKIAYSPTFRFFVQETEPPYLMSLVRVDDELVALEDEKVKRSIHLWDECLRTNKWPGYNIAGYDVGLTEYERRQEMQEPKTAHVASEDVPDSSYSPITFNK